MMKLKVSKKGRVSLCGLRRLPVSLTPHEWMVVLNAGEHIKEFMRLHESELSHEDNPATESPPVTDPIE